MKPLLTFALVISLGLNATLAYFAFSGAAQSDAEAAAQAAAAAAETARTARSGGPATVDPKTWASLNTTELPELVTRLRAAGFPTEVIRGILQATLDEQFAARRRALDPEGEKRAFWKNQPVDNKFQLAFNQLYREQYKILKDLLGEDAQPSDAVTLAQQRQQYGYLPPEKITALQALIRAHGDKQTDLYFQKGSLGPEESKALEAELQRNIAALLTPAEFEEYQFRNSNTARNLRNELLAFNPTEEEFRALVKLRLPFEQDLSGYTGFPSAEVQQRINDAEKRFQEQATAVLGQQRAEEYNRARDYRYRQTAQLVARLELPPETTQNLWTVQQEFNKRRQELSRSLGPTPGPLTEEALKQLAALQQEAIARVTPLLGGASRVEAYKQYGGNWITGMIPQRRPPAQGGK